MKRLVCLLVTVSMLVNACYGGVCELTLLLPLAQSGDLPEYVDEPGASDPGPDPDLDATYRAGTWNDDLLLELGEFQMLESAEVGGGGGGGGGMNSMSGGMNFPGDPGAGPGFPWEAGYDGGGSQGVNALVVTNTGNHYLAVPMASWTVKGGQLDVSLTLHHNSKGNYAAGFGQNWACDYHASLFVATSGNVLIRWGTGQTVPFTKNPSTGVLVPPKGIYDSLVREVPTGDYILTTKNQIKYIFTAGHLRKIRDRNGYEVTVTRGFSNRIQSVSDVNGRALTFSYPSGFSTQVSQVSDCAGQIWTFGYSGANLTSVGYPAAIGVSRTRSFAYDSLNNITSETDLRSHVWSFAYDAQERTLNWKSAAAPSNKKTQFFYAASYSRITMPEGQMLYHAYSAGRVWQFEDAAGFRRKVVWNNNNQNVEISNNWLGGVQLWTLTPDASGNITRVADPENRITDFTYTSQNNLQTVSQVGGASGTLTTEYEYDANGNLTEVWDPLHVRVLLNQYQSGLLISTTDGENRVTSYGHDTWGNVTSVTDAAGQAQHGYDILGRPAWFKDAFLNETQYSYNEIGELRYVTHPGGVFRLEYIHDKEGNVKETIDELNYHSYLTYDFDGRLQMEENARGNQQTYTHNHNNWVLSITNGRGKTRNFLHTPRGEVKRLNMPDGTYEEWSYTATGQIAQYRNMPAQTIRYSRFLDDQLRYVEYTGATPSLPKTDFYYDAFGRMNRMAEGTGGPQTLWAYDVASRLTSITRQVPGSSDEVVQYEFNNADQRTKMIEVGVGQTTYGYDSTGRLSSLTNPLSETTTWEHDANDRLTRVIRHNGTRTDYGYDSWSRPTSVVHKKADLSVISQESYTYDATDNLTAKAVDGTTTLYNYDPVGQLWTESRPGYLANFEYDANGNRSWQIVQGIQDNYQYDDGDKLLSITRGGQVIRSFTYDAAGRTKTVSAGGSTVNFEYDPEDRVTKITYPNAAINTFAYSAVGARRSKVDSAGTLVYKRDGFTPDAPVLADGAATYTPGISERRGGATKFYNMDFLGSTKQLTASDQSVTDTRGYDAFGNLVSTSGSTPTPVTFAGSWGYQRDADSGLMLLGNRYYDPSLGRFITRDPVGDGRNWYIYAKNNPLYFIDPTGFQDGNWFVDAVVGLGNWVWNDARPALGHLIDDNLLGGQISNIGYTHGLYESGHASGFDVLMAWGGLALEVTPVGKGKRVANAVYRNVVGKRASRVFTHAPGAPRSTYRSAHWKARAKEAGAAQEFNEENLARMRKGRAPQRVNPETGKLESKHLSHEPKLYSKGGTRYRERWPAEHLEQERKIRNRNKRR